MNWWCVRFGVDMKGRLDKIAIGVHDKVSETTREMEIMAKVNDLWNKVQSA